MGTQMNIKSDEAYALATEIAGITGESLTQVVLEALRARQRTLTKAERVERLMAFAAETAAMMTPEMRAFDIDKELYDEETGLPK